MSLNPVRVVARFPRPVRLLLIGTLVNKLGTFIVPYLTLVLLRDFHMTEGEVALLLFAYGSGSVVSILTGGVLTDRLGRRRTLLLSLLGSGALAVLMGLLPSPRFFVPLLVAFGFIADLYRPAASAVIGDLLPSSERATGFAGLRMAVNLGWASGTALGGLLADWDWRLLFLGDGLTTLSYGVLVYFLIPETRPLSSVPPTPDATRDAGEAAGPDLPPSDVLGRKPTGPLGDSVFLEAVAVSFLFTLIFCSHLVVLPLTVTRSAGYPAVVFGLMAALNGVLVALFEITIVAKLKRFRRLRLAALGYTLAALGFGMIGLVMHWAWFLLAVVVFTLGEILSAPQQMAFVADWAPPEARGRYLSLYQATWSIAFAVNPALTLPLHEALGERLFWGLMPLVALPGVVVLLRLDATVDRPERLRGLSSGPPPLP
ncbi:MAG TPA: MFS transporter [Vicinamibacteria bacterium]|nr:MFS transporter [Vicinamibacteria bacterium]